MAGTRIEGAQGEGERGYASLRKKLSTATTAVARTAQRGAAAAAKAAKAGAVGIGDLNGDGKVDREDAKIAGELAAEAASGIGRTATDAVKAGVKSDIAKSAAGGALTGAVLAVPIPLIGPAIGATAGGILGAAISINGALKSGGRQARTDAPAIEPPAPLSPTDLKVELTALEELRSSGMLSDAEYRSQKRKLLQRS
jgi:hypothetical protein